MNKYYILLLSVMNFYCQFTAVKVFSTAFWKWQRDVSSRPTYWSTQNSKDGLTNVFLWVFPLCPKNSVGSNTYRTNVNNWILLLFESGLELLFSFFKFDYFIWHFLKEHGGKNNNYFDNDHTADFVNIIEFFMEVFDLEDFWGTTEQTKERHS